MGILNFDENQVSGDEEFFLRNYLRDIRSGVVLDVGANIGNYSKLVLKINPHLQVYAFEPHPVTFGRLIENIKSERLLPVNSAVGDSEGVLSLYDYADDDGSAHASLYQDVIENIHKKPSVEHRVKIIKLDDFLERVNVNNVALLKIDTEGHELAVLLGLEKFIKLGRVEAIHFEFNEMNVSSRTFFRDFFTMLGGYNFYRLLPRGMVRIAKYNPSQCEIFAFQNIVAIRKNSKDLPTQAIQLQ
jgi:FkbM family methyltransferase